MASKVFPSLAAIAFATMLFNFFLNRRSREINGGEANNNAAANDGIAGGASATHTSTESHEMGVSSKYDYEVFLSFRGSDTRASFTDFLYTSLTGAGIRAYKDDEDLSKGEEFGPELLQAIKQSKILIPIFSKGYASSVWCLKELVQMVECQKNERQKILPIFFDVTPSEVRHQTGSYEEAFCSHKNKNQHDKKIVQDWKDALSAVGAISGWDLQKMSNRREGEFVKTFTQKVLNELKKASLVVSNCLVGVDDHVDKIMEMIGAWTRETRIIGIHGMGGIGKTTIAKFVYNQLSKNFKNCCFLSNIREMSQTQGIVCLQKQLLSDILKKEWTNIRNFEEGTQTIRDRLSNKRVLILLDDVDHKRDMDALVGSYDWFGGGSKLIITTRNKEVLKVHGVKDLYEVNIMDPEQSLQLFSIHAFRRDYPLAEYIDQSKRAVEIARGLPLALEIIGSLLAHTEKEKWDVKLEKLADVPHEDVQNKLRISYDALEDLEKHIFLDIACLFIGYDKDIMVSFWESEFHPEYAMDVLENMSLIKIKERNKVWMHDQLRDLGRQKVLEESKRKLEKQSRVWNPEKGLDLLKRHEGKTKVEALCLKLDDEGQYHLTYEDFKRLSNLRFLEVAGLQGDICAKERLLRHEWASNFLPTNVFQENLNLLPRLRWLSWHDIPPTFTITNFSIKDVVILDLSWSEIMDDWNGWSHMKVMKNLKVLDLKCCNCLKKTPHFSAHSSLKRLILSNCESLIEIDGSICQLKCLVFLDVSNCENLRKLPNELGGELTSLEYLSLKYCKLLERLPNTIGNLESLIELDISSTGIKKLPDSIGKLKKLKVMKMRWSNISKIPDAFWTIQKLEEIEASNGFGTDKIHVKIGNGIYMNQSLRILRLMMMDISTIPRRLPESLIKLQLSTLYMNTFPDLSNLTNLMELDLTFSKRYDDRKSYGPMQDPMPLWLGNLSKLESLALSLYCETTSPTNFSLPPRLKSLRLSCSNLYHLPRLPYSLSSLDLCLRDSLFLMEYLLNLKKLSSLKISNAAIAEIQGLGCLENLRDLELRSLQQVKILPDLSNLNKLRSLQVRSCRNLVEIQGELPRFLDILCISSCHSLQNLPDLSSLMGKQNVEISFCGKLKNVEAILRFAQKSSRDLKLVGFNQLHILPDLNNSDELRRLRVENCGNLVEIQGEPPQSLEELKISSCELLQKLPNLSSLKKLRRVDIEGCVKLKGEAILGSAGRSRVNLWKNLLYLRICGLGQVEILPDLSNSNKLRHLQVEKCGDLVEIQGELPQSLEKLNISSCESLQKLPDLSSLKKLQQVDIEGCTKLKGEAILGATQRSKANLWENLKYLRICGLGQVEILPDLSNSNNLRCLRVENCCDLVEIEGELPQSLKELNISSCKSLQKLPDLSSLKELQKLVIDHCGKLNVEVRPWLWSEKLVKFVVEYHESEYNSEFEPKGEDEE